jgi:hypothetical protein
LERLGLTVLASEGGKGRYWMKLREPPKRHDSSGRVWSAVVIEACDERSKTVCQASVESNHEQELELATTICKSLRP